MHGVHNGNPYCILTITSDILCNDLIKLGCHQRKSFTAQFPLISQLQEQFVSSFVCGLFDGDGCIYVKSHRETTLHIKIEIVVSYALGMSLREIIFNRFGWSFYFRPAKPIINNNSHGRVWRLGVGGNPRGLRFMEWIYANVPFAMERKRQRYKQVRGFYDADLCFIQTPEWIERKRQRVVRALVGRPVSLETRALIGAKKRVRDAAKRASCLT